jgi:transcriptional regulator with XRE-family HTH domain
MAKPSRPPTARLRRLASELTMLRQKARLTREDIAERTGINQATLYRIETAKARPQSRTLTTLLDLYGVDPDKREALIALFRSAKQQNWLQPYQEGLPAEYNTFISFESEAKALWTYEMSLVPGLLQTENYARAVIRGMLPSASAEEVEHRVETRMRRQASVLDKENPPRLWAIVDEAALHREVGSADIMREQITHLQNAMERPEVNLQLLPFDAGAHPAMLGAFVILKFNEPVAPDIVYIEGILGDIFLDDATSIERYTDAFEHLRAIALRPTRTAEILASLAERT